MILHSYPVHGGRGFSLMEVLVAVALFVLLMAALVSLYLGYTSLFVLEQMRFTLGTSANIALSEMEEATRQARQVLSSRVLSGDTYTTDADTLVLELPSVTADGTVVSGSFDYVAFYVSGTALYRLRDADDASARESGIRQLGGEVSAFALTYDTADPSEATEVSVDLTLALQKGQHSSTLHTQQEVYLRNKE